MKIDLFNHILPKPYFDRLVDIIPDKRMLDRYPLLPTLWDLDTHCLARKFCAIPD